MKITDRPSAPHPSQAPPSGALLRKSRAASYAAPPRHRPCARRRCGSAGLHSADRTPKTAAGPKDPRGACRSGGRGSAKTDVLPRWRRVVELAPHRCHRWEAAWEDLAHLLRPLLAGWIHYTLLELGRPPLEVDELIQDVYLKLLAGEGRLMRNFSARSEGQLRSYLRRTCQSCVQDALRRTLASKRGSDRTVALTAKGQESLHSRTVDPERRMIRRSHLAAFRRAVAECAERLSRKPERNRWIFEQAILEGRSSASIGREVGLGTSGVDSVVSRIRLRLARQGWEVDKRAVG